MTKDIKNIIIENNKLLKENNVMLKYIARYIHNHSKSDDPKDFLMNIVANILSNTFRF